MRQEAAISLLLQAFMLNHITGQIDSAILSRNKTITSSDTYSDWVPERAIDGNPSRDADNCRCCAAIDNQFNPWYELDLGKRYAVKRIHVLGRDDNNGQFFNRMRILLHSVSGGIDSDFETSVPSDQLYEFNYVLPQQKSTRFVSLALYDTASTFTVCELIVYGECADGEFGDYCEHVCHCDGDPCNKTTGLCPSGKCLPGYNGTACNMVCQNGTYGSGCTESCGNCIGAANCNHTDGRCPAECASGFQGDTCTQECDDGHYGLNCINRCGSCHNGEPCNKKTGYCENGCAAGYQNTTKCENVCESGNYGVGCIEKCGECKDSISACSTTNGSCPAGCKAGFEGDICKSECDNGHYGENCLYDCGSCLNGEACGKETGVCTGGCGAGYTGDLCVGTCPAGAYGTNCSAECGNCVSDTTCHHVNGACTEGCTDGFKHPLCKEASEEPTGKVPVAALGGAVGGVVGISAIIATIFIIVRRRRTNSNSSKNENGKMSGIGDTKESATINLKRDNERVADSTSNPKSKDLLLAKYSQYEPKTNGKKSANPSMQTSNDTDMYYGFLTRATDLKLCQLWDYIAQKKKDDNLLFYQEFNCLTSGLQHPHDVALLKGNKPLTRYRALCAYDHSRVPLDTSDGGNGYINASFINGTDTPRKFIASQGPTVTMRKDFWRMIWQYNSSKIVMLTNLFEMGTEKCLTYWPEEEPTDVTYGNITVSLVSKHVTTDYDIRKLKVRKDSSPARNVTQYHFKAWPDKDVPDSTWPLVRFWRTVMEDSIDGSAPIVVHCSAGIGRTGTFIAMDNAYHQAKGTGNITMLELVKTLRDQRVNMVQTKDQYVFLHEAVADALLFGTHIIWSRDFENIYKFLTQLDLGRSMTRMQQQFNLIVESVDDRKRLERRNGAAVSADIYSNIFTSSSPTETSITIDEYVPKSKSMENVREHSAVLLPNYEMKDAFIVCSSPTGASFEGLWSIISEQNIKTVIMMTDSTSKHYKKCKELGVSDKKVESSFGVKCLDESMTKTSFHKRFTFDSMDGPKDVSQFEFNNWPNGCLVPKDSRSMLDFLEIVLQWQQRLTSTQPILVHCSTGFERSGLVCVLLNELERMKREQGHINILETVKLMKERNEHIIPNFEQYKYVYDTILETFHKDTANEETMPDDNVYENCQQ